MDRKRKKCQYGAKCYRQNRSHLEEYDHSKSDSDCNESPKKQKLTKSPKKFKQAKLCFQPKATVNSDKPSNHCLNKEKISEELQTEAKQTTPLYFKKKIDGPSPRRKKEKIETRTLRIKPKRVVKESSDDESDQNTSNACDVTSNSWTFQRNSSDNDAKSPDTSEESDNSDESDNEKALKTKLDTAADKIKYLFLVDMPDDFYSFFNFCRSLNDKAPLNAFKAYGIQLVGPFDVLSEKINVGSVTREQALCHWRHFLDPPELQTIFIDEEGTHYGYWRDNPKTIDCFIASNTVPACTIQAVAPTIFGAVIIHMTGYLRRCSPFEKPKASNVLSILNKWAEKENMDTCDSNDFMKARKKKIVAPTFHGLGIVVDVNRKTDVGYRPLLETNGNLKKICNGIINGKNSAARVKMEEIEKLVNAANIANDEGDFGNALELGIDLFCMGSDLFHNHIKHLLVTAYTLLDRPEWAKIIKAHLKNRRADRQLCAIKNASK